MDFKSYIVFRTAVRSWNRG